VVPAPVMIRDRGPQFRNPHHRRVLVVAADRSVRGGAADILRAGIVGKTLAEVDRVVIAGRLRHRLEDGYGKVSKDLVHGSHGAKKSLESARVQPPVLVGSPAAFQPSIPPARWWS